jgi:hypothetical protein
MLQPAALHTDRTELPGISFQPRLSQANSNLEVGALHPGRVRPIGRLKQTEFD